jgi:hypothetical protein
VSGDECAWCDEGRVSTCSCVLLPDAAVVSLTTPSPTLSLSLSLYHQMTSKQFARQSKKCEKAEKAEKKKLKKVRGGAAA